MPADKSNYGVVSEITTSNERQLYEALVKSDENNELETDLRGRNPRQNITKAEMKVGQHTTYYTYTNLYYITYI